MAKYQKLRQYIREIKELKKLHWKDPKSSVWINKVLRYLKSEVGEDYYKQFYNATHGPVIVVSGTPDSEFQRQEIERLNKYQRYLESFLEELQQEHAEKDKSRKISKKRTIKKKSILSRKIFVVHGRDLQARDELVTLLKDEFKLDPIVLMNKPNQGRTLIEKFEKNSIDVDFAIILLTPDDVGGLKTKKPKLVPRPRENVILELGYFLGKLGRERICCVRKGRPLLPTDLHGIVDIPYKKSIKEIFYDLKKELEAGYSSP